MKISKLSYLSYNCRVNDKTCKFQPNHNETTCAPFEYMLKTSYNIRENDNDKQLYIVCLLCDCNLCQLTR